VKNKIWNKNKYPIENSKPYLCPCVSWTIKINKTHEKKQKYNSKMNKRRKTFRKKSSWRCGNYHLIIEIEESKSVSCLYRLLIDVELTSTNNNVVSSVSKSCEFFFLFSAMFLSLLFIHLSCSFFFYINIF
jgi:hypothetical protein